MKNDLFSLVSLNEIQFFVNKVAGNSQDIHRWCFGIEKRPRCVVARRWRQGESDPPQRSRQSPSSPGELGKPQRGQVGIGGVGGSSSGDPSRGSEASIFPRRSHSPIFSFVTPSGYGPGSNLPVAISPPFHGIHISIFEKLPFVKNKTKNGRFGRFLNYALGIIFL